MKDSKNSSKEEVCGAYGGTISKLGHKAEIVCQRKPGHKRPHRAAPFGWPQVWERPVPRNPRGIQLPEIVYPKSKDGHFDGPQKDCFEYGCTDDCTARANLGLEDLMKSQEPPSFWQRIKNWFLGKS